MGYTRSHCLWTTYTSSNVLSISPSSIDHNKHVWPKKTENLCPLARMSTTLPLFWKLSSASKKDRVDASVKLISALEQFQAQYVPQSRSDGSDNEGVDGLDALNSQDVSYSIRRLVRGLASPRESSRLGFSVALTEVCPSLLRPTHHPCN